MADWCEFWSRELASLRFGDESLMRRGRAADRGSAVKPEARQACPVALPSWGVPRLYLLGRAVRFLGRKEGTGHGMGSAAVASGAGALRCPCQCCAWSSGWACPPLVLASRARTRHGSSGIIMMRVRAEAQAHGVPYRTVHVLLLGLYGLGCHSFGAFHVLNCTRFCAFLIKGNKCLFDAVLCFKEQICDAVQLIKAL